MIAQLDVCLCAIAVLATARINTKKRRAIVLVARRVRAYERNEDARRALISTRSARRNAMRIL